MRLINADDIEYADMLAPMGNGNYEHVGIVTESEIEAMPTADAVRVVHGKWELLKCWTGFETLYCSECNYETNMASNYCPNCGARMYPGRKEYETD